MKKQLFLLLFLLCAISAGFAQKINFNTAPENKTLVIDSLMNGSMYPKRIQNLQFIPKSDVAVYEGGGFLIGLNTKEKRDTIFSLAKLNEALQTVEKSGYKELKMFPPVKFQSTDTFTVVAAGKLYKVSLKGKTAVLLAQIPTGAQDIQINYETNKIAYTKENSLYLYSEGKELIVATDENKDIVFGQAVHQREFGIEKGIFWSPKATMLAFYRMDQTMVNEYPIVNTAARTAEATPIRYPMAGLASHQVTLGVYNIATGKTVYLQTRKDTSLAEKENYLTNITWSPDEKNIYIQKLNRAQNHVWLERYNAQTGVLEKILFEETSTKYVEPLNPLCFIPKKNNEFLYMSQRDGYFHIYLYDTAGNMQKQLTKGNWVVNSIEGFDEKGTHCFFYATKDSPLETNFYALEIKSGKITRITPKAGTHTVVANTSGAHFIDSYSNTTTPFQVDMLNKDGKAINTLYTAGNPLANYKMPVTEVFTIKAADGNTDLYCRMIKPANFDPNKKYPAIIYVYGGPHAQMITNSWLNGSGLFLNYLAQEGYIIFTVDSRGSANRGFEFESVIHRNLGDAERADQMEGVKYLKSQPFIDGSRIGVDGWSYGGFMTISLKLRNPGVFKVATAGGPVIDWKWYEIMYGERYAGSPNDNAEGYKKASLLNQVDKLEGKLMIIHGAEDPVVVWQHSLEFINQCIVKKKQVDYFVYPHHEHNVRGMDRVHLFNKLFNYYKENL